MQSNPYVAFDDVAKEDVPGVKALQGVASAHEGRIHALLGEDARKVHLAEGISGSHQPTTGQIRLGGKATSFRNTSDAIASGIAVIYQELHLIPEMTVAENLLLGHYPSRLGVVNRKTLLAEAGLHLSRLGEQIDSCRPPWKSVDRSAADGGDRKSGLSRAQKVIAFDEPAQFAFLSRNHPAVPGEFAD